MGAVLTWVFDVTCALLAWVCCSPAVPVCLVMLAGAIVMWVSFRTVQRERSWQRREAEAVAGFDPVDIADLRRRFAIIAGGWLLGGEPAAEDAPAEDDPEGAR